jgi:hypothetical protein
LDKRRRQRISLVKGSSLINDRPTHLLGQADYKKLPEKPFAVDFQALPELVRKSFAPLGGI